MKLLEYLLEKYTECTDGLSAYSEYTPDIESSFEEDVMSFLDNMLIYSVDIKNLANTFGADIITLALESIKSYDKEDIEGLDLEKMVSIALHRIYAHHYYKFFEIFKNN